MQKWEGRYLPEHGDSPAMKKMKPSTEVQTEEGISDSLMP